MKRWFRSKTLLANVLFGAAIVIQAILGEPWLDAEVQGAIIVLVNVALRFITKLGLRR